MKAKGKVSWVALLSLAAVVLALVAVALAVRQRGPEPPDRPAAAVTHAAPSPPPPETAPARPAAEASRGFLYGRVTAVDGAIHEGRLRIGGDEEAFWDDYFIGARRENRWAADVPPGRLPTRRVPIEIFGFEIAHRERPLDLARPFMTRFGHIARIEAHGRDVLVTLESGSVVVIDRFGASDFDDGVRVWDDRGGAIDLGSRQVRAIEFLPTPALASAPARLHGTVHTTQGEFTGHVRWNRTACVGSDELRGVTAEGPYAVRFDAVRSIARRPLGGARVTLHGEGEVALAEGGDVGEGSRGVEVHDPRYGRVLVPWEAFERLELGSDGSGPGYDDLPAGRPLSGTVTTRAGDRLTGRLVFDLDESESIETLDAPLEGVSFSIPFGLIASVVRSGLETDGARRVVVALHDGEELRLEPSGDLGEGHAGMLAFVEDGRDPSYVPWADVERIDFDRP